MLKVPARVVSQAELAAHISLRNKIYVLQRELASQSDDLLTRLQAGSDVETGKHFAEIVRHKRVHSWLWKLKVR